MNFVRRNPKEQARRAMIIIILVAAIDAAGVPFVSRPVLWAAWVPALIPLLFGIFIVAPMNRSPKG